MRLPELFLLELYCTSENKYDVKVAMSKSSNRAYANTPEVRSVEEVAADAA
jgi:hypothetical protein